MTKAYERQSPLKVFQDLLGRWAAYVHRANLMALGYSQSRYTEYVGSGARTADAIDDIDPDILSWDEFYKKHLPSALRDTIHLHWLAPGPVKAKHRKNGNQAYYARKTACEETALEMWTAYRNEQRAQSRGPVRATAS